MKYDKLSFPFSKVAKIGNSDYNIIKVKYLQNIFEITL